MSRTSSSCLCLVTLLTSFAALHGEEAKKPRTDLYGDPLPRGAVARMGTLRLRHAWSNIIYSKDGKTLISCDGNGEVRTWDVATGRLLQRQQLVAKRREDEEFGIHALSPDGKIVVIRGQGIYLYDIHTGKKQGRIASTSKTHPYLHTLFSPDGELLVLKMSTVDRNTIIRICEVKTLKTIQTLTMPPGVKLSNVAFSWDGKRLLGIAEKPDNSNPPVRYRVDLFQWDTITGKLLRTRKNLHQTDADVAAFSPDGKTLVLGGRGAAVLRVLDADALKDKSLLTAPASLGSLDFLIHPVFSPDGRRLAAFCGIYQGATEGVQFWQVCCLLLWELPAAKEPKQLPAHNETTITFSPDGKSLCCHGVRGMSFYDTVSGLPLRERPGHDSVELALTVSSDGKMLASGDCGGTLRLWDTTTSKQRRRLAGWNLVITDCFWSADGKRVAAGNLGGRNFDIQAWETDTSKKLGRFSIHAENGCLYAAAMTADGKHFAGVYTPSVNEPPAEIILWDVPSGRQLNRRPYKLKKEEDSNGISYRVPAAFSPDGERLTVWLGDRLGIEDVLTGSLLAKLPKEGTGWPPVFSPDGRLLLTMFQPWIEGSLEKEGIEVRSLIEAASGQEIARLELKAPNKIAFTPDSQGLIVSGSKNVHVRHVFTGEKLYQMEWPDGIENGKDRYGSAYHSNLAALPGGRVAISMADGDILVWDLQASTWPKHRLKRELDREELVSLWSDLAADARTAYRAIANLSASPVQTTAFLREHLRTLPDGKDIEKLVADLDSDSYSTRERAVRELRRRAYRSAPMLRWTLDNKPSLEMRRRIEPILTEPRLPSREDLRASRAIAMLERIGTPEARHILEKLASGASSPETRAAEHALKRLKYR